MIEILFSASEHEAGRQPVWDFVKANFDAIIARMPREATGEAPFLALGGIVGLFAGPAVVHWYLNTL